MNILRDSTPIRRKKELDKLAKDEDVLAQIEEDARNQMMEAINHAGIDTDNSFIKEDGTFDYNAAYDSITRQPSYEDDDYTRLSTTDSSASSDANENTFTKFVDALEKWSKANNNPQEAIKLVSEGASKGISLLDPNGDKALLTEEQKTNYANNNLSNLSQEDIDALKDFAKNQKNTSSNAINNIALLNEADIAGTQAMRLAGEDDKQEQRKKELQEKLGIDEDTFKKYVASANYLQNLDERKKQQEEIASYGTAGMIGANAADMLLSPIRSLTNGIGYLNEYTNPYRDENFDIDHNAPGFELSNLDKDVTQQTSKNIDENVDNEAGKFALQTLYQGGKSGIESMLRLGTVGQVGTIAEAGLEAYDNAREEAQERGLTKTQAIETAMAQGMAEAAFEVLPVENLGKLFKQGGEVAAKGVKNVFKEIGKQSAFEGLEEVETNLANLLTDAMINKDKSEFNVKVEDYKAQGMDEDEAFKTTLMNTVTDNVQAFLGGAVGGLLGGGTAVGSNVAMQKEAKKLDGNYKEVAQAIPDNVEDYNSEEDYNKAMEVKAKAEELDTQDKVSNADRSGLLQDIYAVNETMPNVDLIENINESVNSPFANVGGFQVAKNNITSQQVAESMASAQNVNDFVEAYRDSQASSDIQARQTGQQYFETLAPKFDDYNEGSRPLDIAMSQRSAEDIYNAALNNEEVADEELNTARKQQLFQRGVAQYNLNRQIEAQRQVRQEDSKTVAPEKLHNIETPQGKADIADITMSNDGSFVWKKGEEEVVIPKKDISDNAMKRFMVNATNQPTLSAKQLYVDNYDGSIPIGSYNNAYNSAFNAGKLGHGTFKSWLSAKKFYAKQIPVETLEAFYNEGAKQLKGVSKKVTKAKVKGTGKVTVEKGVENTPIHRLAEAIASKTGVDFEIRDGSILVTDNAKNALKDEEGNEIYSNGQFKADVSKVVLGVNDKAYQTLAHEAIGEFLEAYNPEDMQEIQDTILTYLLEEKGDEYVDNTIKRYQRLYQSAEGSKSYRDAANEMVNDTLIGLFTTDKGAKDFVDWCNSNNKKSTLDKIADFIQAIIDKLKSLISDANLSSAAKNVAKMSEKQAQEIRDRLFKAMDKAIENYQGTTEDATATNTRNSLDNLENKTRFSLAEPVEQKGNLIAVHNMGASELLQTIELGGFPMPSIAVIKENQGHEKYGNTSILFYKDTIDPKKSKKNKIYGGDAWTPTFPSIEYKVDARVADRIRETIDNLVSYDEQGEMRFLPLDNDNLETSLNNTRGNIEKTFEGNETMQLAFLRDKGIDLDVPSEEKRLDEKFTNEQIVEVAKLVDGLKEAEQLRMSSSKYDESKQLIEKMRNVLNAQAKEYYKGYDEDLYDELTFTDFDHLTRGIYRYYKNGIGQQLDNKALNEAIREEIKTRKDEYDKWLHELFDGIIEKTGLRNNKDYFTYSGNRRSWETLHDDYTLDNIVKIMSQQDDRGANAFFSQSAIKGLATRTFNNLTEVKNSASQLRSETEEEHEQRLEEQSGRFTEICQEIMDKKEDNHFIAFGRASDAIAEVIKDHRTVEGIDRELREYTSLNIQDDTAQKIVDLLKDIENNPTEYFEAKPKRAVGLEEIARVITPSNETELIDALEENNIPYSTYEAGNEEDRLNKLNAVEDVRFSLAVDTEGNELSEGQQEYFKDSKIRDEHGRLLVVYHGTPNGNFTVFKYPLNYFTDNKEYASFYQEPSASSSGVRKEKINPTTFEGYLNITKPFDINNADDRRIFIDEYVKGGNALGINPYISDAEIEKQISNGIDWNETENLLDFIQENDYNYDGMIIDEGGYFNEEGSVIDRGKAYVAFNSNQFKNIDNENPTESEDIRYSLDVPTTYALDEEYSPFIDDDIAETKESKGAFVEIIKAANSTLNYHISDKRIEDIADKVIAQYSSKIDKDFVTKNLRNIFGAMSDNNIEDMSNALINLSEEVIRQSEDVDPYEKENYEDFARNMPTFTLSENQKQEAINIMGDWNTVFAAVGRFLNNDSHTLDGNTYWDICDNALAHGYTMDRDASDTEQLSNIISAIDALTPQSRALFKGADITDASLVTANEIMQQYYDYALKDKQANANLKDVKADLRTQVDDYKKAIGKQYQEQVKRLQKEIKDLKEQQKYANQKGQQLYDRLAKAEKSGDSELVKKLKQENWQLNSDLRQAERMAQRDKKSISRQVEREARNKHLNSIKKQAIRLIKMIDAPTRDKFVPDVIKEQTIEMLQSFDFVTYRVRKNGELVPWGEEKGGEPTKTTQEWHQRMELLQNALNELEEVPKTELVERYGASANYVFNLSVQMGDVTKGLLDQFLEETKDSKVRLSTLKSDKLKILDDFMTSFNATINKAQEAFIDGKNVKLEQIGKDIVSEIGELNSLNAIEGSGKKKVLDFLNLDMAEPVTFFSELGETFEKMFWHLAQGKNVRDKHIFDTEDAFAKKKEELEIGKNEPNEWEKGVKSFKNGRLQLTTAQIMSLYAAYQRSQARRHILFGGVMSEDKSLITRKDRKAKRVQNNPVHLTPHDVEEITSTLTDKQKALADFMVDYMSNEVSSWGNRVSQLKWGIKLFTESHYFPIKTYDKTRPSKVQQENGNGSLYALQNQGFTKPLQEEANNALILDDIFSVFADHVAKMAAYDGYVIPISDFMRVYNFAESEEQFVNFGVEEGNHRNDESVKGQIERVFGDGGNNYVRRFIKNVNEDYGEGGSVTVIDKLFSNNKAQAVLANGRVVFQQPTAYPRAMEVIEGKYLVKALSVAGVGIRKKIQRSKSHNSLAKFKSKGYYETSIGQSMKQMITGTATPKEKINEVAGALAGLMDDFTWSVIYNAAELKVQAEQPKLEKNSKEYFVAVNKIADEAFIKTQVVDSVFTKSQMMRSRDTGDKMLTAFMAEPTKYYNMLHRGVFNMIQTGDKKVFAKALYLFVIGQVLNSVAQSAYDAWRDDDDEKNAMEKFLNALIGIDDIAEANGAWATMQAILKTNLFENLLPLNLLPVVKEVTSALAGWDSKNMSTQAIYDIIGDAQKIFNAAEGKGNLTPYGVLNAAAHALSLGTGVPVSQAIREVKDLYNNLNNLWDGENIVKTETNQNPVAKAIESGKDIASVANEQKQEKIQKALEEGKTQKEAESSAKSSIASSITSKYKNKLIELKDEDINKANELKQHLLDAYVAIGYSRSDANGKINKWFK